MKKKTEHIDGLLFQKLLNQPNEGLELIYARYGGSLRAYLRSFIRDNDELIADVVSETLVVLWRKRKEVATLNKPVSWMQRVAKQIAYYKIREEAKYHVIPLTADIDIASREGADDELMYDELEVMILKVCETLSLQERTLFIQSKFEGMSNQELMKQHGIAEQTVKNKLSKALKLIREGLKDLLSVLV